MNDKENAPVTSDELHAYADGQLSAERRAVVESYLAENSEVSAEVAGWVKQNEQIRALVSAMGAGAAPTNPLAVKPTRTAFGWPASSAIAAGLAWFILGAASGGIASKFYSNPAVSETQLASLSSASQSNFLVYASDIRHPVEVGADQKDHLLMWLGKRLGEKIAAPDLSKEGFSLIGGRLITYAEKPAALIMYETAKGERLTLMVGHNESNQTTSFRFSDQANVQTLYWIDGPLGYAISASIGKDRLQNVAHALNSQL